MTSEFKEPSSNPILNQILKEYGKPDTVKIRDAAKLEKLLTEMVAGGSKSLQVIADFDRTLSRSHLEGEKCDSLHGVLAFSPEMPQEFRDQVKSLFDQLYLIETSQKMSADEKLPFIIELNARYLELTAVTGVDKELVRKIVKQSTCTLRDNVTETFNILREYEIPVLIFSAGLGDLMEMVLEQNGIFYPNLKIWSNYMEFDPKTGKICGFKPPLLHPMNKSDAHLFEDDSSFLNAGNRKNALVIGDNLGDIRMSDGMKEPNVIVKIGFLNHGINEKLEAFMDAWDVVLCDDQSMDFVNLILKHILR